ncbi:MAG: cytochrome c3 family protein [Candidatus Aminicenantales bacterium]
MSYLQRPLWLAIMAAGLAFLGNGLLAQKNTCLECHAELEGTLQAPAQAFAQDIHQKYGLTCTACHGGNASQEDMDLAKDRTFRGVPARKSIPELCGGCHSRPAFMRTYNPSLRVDQLELYWTSQHGQLLKKGDTRVAVCTDCHGQHGILPANVPKSSTFPWNIPVTCGRCHADREAMKPFGLPTDQLAGYKESVHARALFEKKNLTAPTCNDCHGNHGATPPQVSSITYVCRQCHSATAEIFSRSPHQQAFAETGIPECEACHGKHKILAPSDEMLGTGRDSVCLQCHEAGSKPYEVASQMRAALDGFLGQRERARVLLDKAERQGVEVSEAKFKLEKADTALIMLRNLTHGLSLEEVKAKAGQGQKELAAVMSAGQAALKEGKSRRVGLVITTGFLFLLAIALFLKIRQIRRKQPR